MDRWIRRGWHDNPDWREHDDRDDWRQHERHHRGHIDFGPDTPSRYEAGYLAGGRFDRRDYSYGGERVFGGATGSSSPYAGGYGDFRSYDARVDVGPWRDRGPRFEDRHPYPESVAPPRRGRGPKNYRRSDERIHDEIHDRLMADPWIDSSEVEIVVADGEVTLNGTVQTRQEKRMIELLCERVLGVVDVHNRLRRPGAMPGLTRPSRTPTA